MGLLSGLVGLPLAPVRGTVWLAEQIQEEAEREYYNPASIRRQLEDIAEARANGDIDPESAREVERDLVGRLIRVNRK